MEAKDTVMSDEQIAEAGGWGEGWAEAGIEFDYERDIAQAQAEITWKAREPEIVEARGEGAREKQ